MTTLELLRTHANEIKPEVLREVERYIRCDPGILAGKPTFVGTRVPVYLVLDCLAYGVSKDEILESFPTLEPEHIPAALKFAGLLSNIR